VTLSFIPPINPFIMMLRIASNDPPPLWQILLSLAVATVGALAAIWLAGKIFRVGMLMFGKPPNFRTLVRWVRMA
jgi:ABC-2 type transport system permease protein